MKALQCYAYRRGQRWHAICTDLDIAVDGESLRAVEASIETGIDMYLERVAELPADERGRFLPRRAPWRIRASLAVWTWLHHLNGDGERRARSFLLESHVAAPSGFTRGTPAPAARTDA